MIIGVTGSLGTGTSSTAGYIAADLKASLIDADKVARDQFGKNTSLVKRIISNFGKEVLGNKGNIDRVKLAKKAFANRQNHRKLCNILHPVIIAEIEYIREKLYKQGISDVVIDAPVLIESGFHKECDVIIVVTSSLSLQLERAWIKKKIRHKDALSRIRLQMPLHKKVRYADYIIDNGSTLAGLKLKSREIVDKIKTKK